VSAYKRFKEIRKELNLTQKEFSEKLGFKDKLSNMIEAGRQKVTPEIALKIEDKFGISGWWLLTGRGEKYLKNNKINVSNSNNVAINNSKIVINKSDYNDFDEIKELLELLKDVPKSWIRKIIDKLKNTLKKIDEEF